MPSISDSIQSSHAPRGVAKPDSVLWILDTVVRVSTEITAELSKRVEEILEGVEFTFVAVEPYLANPDLTRDIKKVVIGKIPSVSFEDAGEFLADEHVNPFVRADVAMRLMRVSLKDAREFLANEDIDATVRAEVAMRLSDTPFAEAEGFLKDETIVFAVRMEVTKRLIEHPPIAELEASGFLRNKKIPLPIRVRVAKDAKKSRLSDGMKGLLDDSSVHTAVRDAVAERVWRTRGKKQG